MANISLIRPFTSNIIDKNLCRIALFSSKHGAEQPEVSSSFINRNPRNLEKLRIAYKPKGYHLEKPGKDFWHKLVLERTSRHVSANIVHYTGPTVITASTNEWAIKKYLYRTLDMSAYSNLGRILAQRCLESGLTEVQCDLNPQPGGKVAALVSALEEGGVILSEPERFTAPRPWDQHRLEKPWEVVE